MKSGAGAAGAAGATAGCTGMPPTAGAAAGAPA